VTDWGEVEIYLERPHNSELELQLDSGSDTLVSVARTAALPVVTCTCDLYRYVITAKELAPSLFR